MRCWVGGLGRVLSLFCIRVPSLFRTAFRSCSVPRSVPVRYRYRVPSLLRTAFRTGRDRIKKLLNKKSRPRNADFLRSKIEKIVSGCKPTGSWRGRGAKPPDCEGVGSPGHAPKQPQNDHQRSRLSAENRHSLLPLLRPVPCVGAG